MLNKGIGDRKASGIDLQNLVDAPARRIGLESEDAIRRALLQAETAVNALCVQLPRRLIRRGEIRLRRSFNWGRGAQSRNLPRFKMSLGSSARLMAAIDLRSLGDVPQTLIADFSADGQRVTTAEPSRGNARRKLSMVAM